MVLKDDMSVYFYCLHVYIFLLLMICLLYGIHHHVLYIIIVLVLLLYLLLPPSFYHSLGRFLTTLGLCAQIGDPSYSTIR